MHTILRVGAIYVSKTTVIVGDVILGEDCNIWHHTVIRGDIAPVRIGKRVNMQDGSLAHCKHDVPLTIGDDVAIGHHAVVHGRSVGDRTLIGTRATILDDCVIGSDCLIAAGTMLTPGTIIPDGSVVMGSPGQVVGPINDEQREYIRSIVQSYIELASQHAAGRFTPYADID